VLRDQPNSDQAMVMMAQANMLNGEPEVAESNWRKALVVNSSNMLAIKPLVNVMLGRGDAVRAEELLNKSLKDNPENILMLELLVQVQASNKDWLAAEATVAKMKQLPQAALDAKVLEGMLAASQGKHLRAIQVYRDVAEQKPDSPESLMVMLARSYQALGRRDEYFVFLKNFIKDHPESMNTYNALGRAYAADNKWTDAEQILKKALSINSKSLGSYKLLLAVLENQGKRVEVVALYRKGVEEFPENARMMLEFAGYLEVGGDYDSAIFVYEGLLKNFPNNEVVVNNYANLLLNSTSSHADVQKALILTERFKESSNPNFLDTYGWVLFKSNNFDQAVNVLSKSAKVAPDNAEVRYHLGEALYAMGDYSASKLELQATIFLVQEGKNKFVGVERAKQLLSQIDNKS